MVELTEESTNLAGFNSISKIRKQRKKVEKKHCVTTSCRGKWKELTNVRIAFSKRLRQYFPRERNNYLLRHDTFSTIFSRISNVHFHFSSLTFSILNQIVSDCTPAKTSCKTFWTKVNQAAKVFMYFENSRESETKSEALKAKIALPHRGKWRDLLTGKESFCKEVGEMFSPG